MSGTVSLPLRRYIDSPKSHFVRFLGRASSLGDLTYEVGAKAIFKLSESIGNYSNLDRPSGVQENRWIWLDGVFDYVPCFVEGFHDFPMELETNCRKEASPYFTSSVGATHCSHRYA